jgi:hypothetical protein
MNGNLEQYYNEIFDYEENYYEEDKINNKYYIGMYTYYSNDILLASTVSLHSFFKYNINIIIYYLYSNCLFFFRMTEPNVNILKLCITSDGTYTVLIKTFWLKIVQRHVKKLYREQYMLAKRRGNLKSLHYREINGKYAEGLNNFPTLYGILSCYRI